MMRKEGINLYSFIPPLAILPLMSFQLDQIGPYLRGDEFLTVVAGFIAELLASVADGILDAVFAVIFGI